MGNKMGDPTGAIGLGMVSLGLATGVWVSPACDRLGGIARALPTSDAVSEVQPQNPFQPPQPSLNLSPPPLQPAPTVPTRLTLPLYPAQSWPENLGLDLQLGSLSSESDQNSGDRAALLRAIDHSLRYLDTPAAIKAYRNYPVPGITRDRVQHSLRRFRQLLLTSKTPQHLQAAVQREFVLYEAAGKDDQGSVGFTGYFEPVYFASRQPTEEFRYPVYRLPPDFRQWSTPHPTREALEGKDGLKASQGKLKGQELAWLRDRLDAFLIQVQGSAQLQFSDGSRMTIGYAGHTDYPYTGIGRELVKDGKLKLEGLTLPQVVDYFRQNPQDLDVYLPRNQRFVFFRNTQNSPALGSLGVPVTAERSIATDKRLMPPGALALISTQVPNQALQLEPVSRFVLDQDTGGAIIGPGRVDLFMGTGDKARDRAGLIHTDGKLYYLLLKDSPVRLRPPIAPLLSPKTRPNRER